MELEGQSTFFSTAALLVGLRTYLWPMASYGSSGEEIRRIRWALDSSPPEFSPKSNEPRAAPSARTVGGRV